MIFIIKSNILDRSHQSCNSLPATAVAQCSNSTQQQLNVATQRSNSAQQQRQQQQLLTLKVQNTRFLSSPNNPSCYLVPWISPHLGSISNLAYILFRNSPYQETQQFRSFYGSPSVLLLSGRRRGRLSFRRRGGSRDIDVKRLTSIGFIKPGITYSHVEHHVDSLECSMNYSISLPFHNKPPFTLNHLTLLSQSSPYLARSYFRNPICKSKSLSNSNNEEPAHQQISFSLSQFSNSFCPCLKPFTIRIDLQSLVLFLFSMISRTQLKISYSTSLLSTWNV